VTDAPGGQQRPTLGTPINIGQRQPVDLTIDQSTGYLYISSHVCEQGVAGCIVALNGRNGGSMLRSIALPGAPSQVRVDSDLGLLYVAIPDRQALVEVDVRSGNVLGTISGLPQITALALDSTRHVLYAAHLGGQVTAVDARSAQVIARPTLSGAGLTSIAAARGLVYGINTATHELDVLEPMSQAVARYPVSQEPAAVTAAEDSGAVYVLSSRSDVILQIDPTSGAEIGRVNMAARGGHLGLSSGSNLQTLQPRIVLDPMDDAVFASLPEQGELAAVSNDQFPLIANAIPYVQAPDQPLVASIPGVIWPGGDAGPAQPAPVLNASDNTDQEGI
jgi:DNA-binding beta-propeller fold protein YncE